ncbi:hypothetical protein [Leuconostoc mesenteroides]|uniref:hypothetical protein n=1 Tax=Leuconostoc mesenteroides TaxID=1245 RepID=UPI001362EF3C|nr:hypothetical protein [Leuconostoc mesenteroides]QHM55693.1 hypothetical protein C7M43_00395 [Leuconostoc mesenteroides]
MTFDEAIEHFKNNTDISGTAVFLDDVEDILKKLREEYAPTVEMTEGQAKTILDPEQGENLSSLLTDDTPNFDYLFWEPMTGKEVAQAWLHPETIKVVDE